MIKIDKIFGDKKGNTVIYILLAVGILLLVMGNGFKTKAPRSPGNVLQDELSRQAERILSDIKGVGEVSVMISYGGEDSDKSIFSADNDKRSVSGVLIVADGGESGAVREKIVRAVQAALGVDAHKIEVFERKEKQ